MVEVMFKVDLFRRYLAEDDGGDGGKCVKREHKLVQFYGLRASREFDMDEKKWGGWEVEPRVKLHTVEITDTTKIKRG